MDCKICNTEMREVGETFGFMKMTEGFGCPYCYTITFICEGKRYWNNYHVEAIDNKLNSEV